MKDNDIDLDAIERLANEMWQPDDGTPDRETLLLKGIEFVDAVNPAVVLALVRRLRAAEAIMAKLPRTADGVPITPGMKLWGEEGSSCDCFEWVKRNHPGWANWYSSREAALAAAADGKAGQP